MQIFYQINVTADFGDYNKKTKWPKNVVNRAIVPKVSKSVIFWTLLPFMYLRINRFCTKSKQKLPFSAPFPPHTHWSISVKKWQKLFQVKMAPNFTKFEWYQQWKASQGLKNWLKAIKAIKATVQARYEKKLKFHNFFNWLWFFRPKNSCGALGLTKKVNKGQKGHYKARS